MNGEHFYKRVCRNLLKIPYDVVDPSITLDNVIYSLISTKKLGRKKLSSKCNIKFAKIILRLVKDHYPKYSFSNNVTTRMHTRIFLEPLVGSIIYKEENCKFVCDLHKDIVNDCYLFLIDLYTT